MFEVMIFVLIISFYISLALAIAMFAFRVFLGVSAEINWKEKLLIIVLPLGFGVFMYVKNAIWLKVYRIAIVALLIASFIASLFLFYGELGL